MRTYTRIFCFFIGFAAFAGSSLSADTPSSRIKARLPALYAAKDAGSLGEGADGYVHPRSGANQATTNLIKAENADRKALFVSLAKQNNGSVAAAAKAWAKLMKTKARKGHWFRDANGNWEQLK